MSDQFFVSQDAVVPSIVPTPSKPIPKHTQRAVDQLAWQSKGKSMIQGNYQEELEFCNQEIKVALSKKTWTAMDKCFKWQFIDTYLNAFPWIAQDDKSHVKDMFVHNKLVGLIFDNKGRCIKTLGIMIKCNSI